MNTRVSVDQDMKELGVAKDGMEKRAILVAVREKVLHELGQITNGATNDLARLVERFAHLSLSGSFAAQVGSAVRLLEQNYIGLLEKGVNQDRLQKAEESLVHMRRKWKILNVAKEKTRKERAEIGHW